MPTLEELQNQNAELAKQNAELKAKVTWFEEQFRLAQHQRFGASSEKTHPDQLDLDLFNEAESEADPSVPEPTVETITYRRKKCVVLGKPSLKHCRLRRSNTG